MLIHCNFDELVSPREVKAHPKNRNKHPESQIERLAKILSYQGWRYPIKISNRSGYCTSGHGRLLAAIKNGWTEVPVNYQDYDSDEQEYADVQSDNAIASWSELDLAGINLDLGDLGPDFDIEMLGLEDFTIDVTEKFEPQADEDDVPEEPEEPKAKLGDIYELGEHRLMCGDATKDVDVLLGGKKVEMCFTDPPYGVNYEGGHFHSGDVNTKRKRDRLIADESDEIYSLVVPVIVEHVDGPCYTWFADTKSHALVTSLNKFAVVSALIVWHKINAKYAALGAQYKQRHEPCYYWKPKKAKSLRWTGPTDERTVWEIKRDARNDLHPTQKPVALAERAIKNHDAKSVLDLFGGSGSTLIACEKTNRKCYMMELEPKYIDVIITRWENYTGKKAELIRNAYDQENEEENS